MLTDLKNMKKKKKLTSNGDWENVEFGNNNYLEMFSFGYHASNKKYELKP